MLLTALNIITAIAQTACPSDAGTLAAISGCAAIYPDCATDVSPSSSRSGASLSKGCRHNSHHIRFYHCSQCHTYPVYLNPRFRDPNEIYDD
jgi:hypothetical protein